MAYYDVCIIGAGSAGLTAARFAARLGKRVALIEANRVGGDCTWTGCVPSKALPGRSRARPRHPPWATFTDPEVAHTGYTEEQARQQFGDKVQVSMLPMAHVDRAVTEDTTTEGFIKVVGRSNGKTLGATVVGTRAAEALSV